MANTVPAARTAVRSDWRELVWPREHGSWSLAFEPLALGLLVAPSMADALLAGAVVAAFFARRPLRAAVTEAKPERRAAARVACAACGAIAVGFFLGAFGRGGVAWLPWLLPSVAAGAVFLFFDLRHAGRAGLAEVAGAAAFATMPVALAVIAGRSTAAAVALGLVMLGRAVPTVLTVRAVLRAAKTGVRRPALPVATAIGAVAVGALLARVGLAPRAAWLVLALLAVRAVALLGFPRPALRAPTVGLIEAGLGLLFVIAVGSAWWA